MSSASVRALLLGSVLVAGCKPDPFRPDAGPLRWEPKPGEAADWDIQLADAPFDISTPRAMYTLDLWKAVPAATSLDYGDGAPVAVPAGVHAGAIAQLHAMSPPAIVVCRVGTGAIRLTDPDAPKFPGYEASPPDNPDPRKPDSVIGWSVTDPNERFIDLHEEVRSTVLPLIERRIRLAKDIGCDAIAAAHNDQIAYESSTPPTHGFDKLPVEQSASWADALVDRARDRDLSIGLWSSTMQGLDNGVERVYDWLLIERCAERQQCSITQQFTRQNKAVFAIEYDIDEDGDMNDPDLLCPELGQIADAIIKTAALDGLYRMTCP